MYRIDMDKFKEVLVSELGYDSVDEDIYLKDYPDEIHDELKDSVERWLEDRTIINVDVYGVSV